jgi:hypothetical protein
MIGRPGLATRIDQDDGPPAFRACSEHQKSLHLTGPIPLTVNQCNLPPPAEVAHMDAWDQFIGSEPGPTLAAPTTSPP